MSLDVQTRRALLVKLRSMAEQYERHSVNGLELMRGLRYQIAVQATDVNGDGCSFPACGCPAADCSQRPSCHAFRFWSP